MIKKMSKNKIIANCSQCNGTVSTSKVLFKVEFENDMTQYLCTYCMTECVGDAPEKIKRIIKVRETI